MARSKIPYSDLENVLTKLYTSPNYVRVYLQRPSRQNNIKAPMTLYDRSSGNYGRWGYLCDIEYEIFTGFKPDWTGKLEGQYKYVQTKLAIPLSN